MKPFYCVSQPCEKYGGLYKEYRTNPNLWAVLLLMSRLPFQWEQGSTVADQDRVVRVDPGWEEAFLRTADYGLSDGRTIKQIIRKYSPEEVLELLQNEPDLSSCPVAGEKWWGGPVQLLAVVEARVLQWKRYSKFRILKQEGNKIEVSFGGAKLTEYEKKVLEIVNIYGK